MAPPPPDLREAGDGGGTATRRQAVLDTWILFSDVSVSIRECFFGIDNAFLALLTAVLFAPLTCVNRSALQPVFNRADRGGAANETSECILRAMTLKRDLLKQLSQRTRRSETIPRTVFRETIVNFEGSVFAQV